jgi:hypothetical protein
MTWIRGKSAIWPLSQGTAATSMAFAFFSQSLSGFPDASLSARPAPRDIDNEPLSARRVDRHESQIVAHIADK